MFKPARMTRILLGGHRDYMQDVIDVLHQQRLLHLEDFQDPTNSTHMGSPLDAGDEMSELLVHTRGLLKAMGSTVTSAKAMASDDPAKTFAQAKKALAGTLEKVDALTRQTAELEADLSALAPYAALDIDLGVAAEVRSVKTFVGSLANPVDISVDHELIQAGDKIALIVAEGNAATAEAELNTAGFHAAVLPSVVGTPKAALATATASHQAALAQLAEAQADLDGISGKWGARLAALEAYLVGQVQKTQAPLQFAMTETTFNLEGWIPVDKADKLEARITDRVGDRVYFERLGDAPVGGHHHPDAKDEAPVQLVNKGLAKPYEFMLGLLGRPRYNEIDPTKLMLIFFPLFFGLMVGDVLVGLFILLMGLYLKKNHIFGIGGPAVGRALAMGGFMAIIVGAFVFGEALGMHFVVSDEALEDGEHSWEEIFYGSHEDADGHRVLNAEFPSTGFFHKEVVHHDADANHNVTADGGGIVPHATATEEVSGPFDILKPHGEVHMKAGPIQLGHYSKIHDIQALLAWCILIAIVHLNLAFLIGIRNVAVGHGITLAIQEKVSWITAQIGIGLAVYGGMVADNQIFLAAGLAVFVASIGLLWVGVQKALGAPGFVAILEFLGFFGNILSYTRLAAIGASKAGMALAFAAIGFDVIGGGDVQNPVGWIVYLVGMVLITALAMLSGGLQSLRLQFVEFFGKFYEGGGRTYKPFGRR